MNEMFGMKHLEFDTSSINGSLPLFEELLGENVPLKLTLHWKDITVLFGQYDTDIIIEYTVCMGWKTDLLGSRTFLFDELKMITSLDLQMVDDQVYINILNHKLDTSSDLQRTEPLISTFEDLDYQEFLRQFGFANNWVKKWMNEEYLSGGVSAPYNLEEFKTITKFQEGSMHFFLEVEQGAE
jgi:hypothetical protein